MGICCPPGSGTLRQHQSFGNSLSTIEEIGIQVVTKWSLSDQGWTPRPAENPPRKNDQNRGKLRGKIKVLFPIEYTNDGTKLQHRTMPNPPFHPIQSNTENYSCGLSLRESKK